MGSYPGKRIRAGAGAENGETLLVIQLSCCQLAFPISGPDLIRLADDFDKTARTLSVGGGKPN